MEVSKIGYQLPVTRSNIAEVHIQRKPIDSEQAQKKEKLEIQKNNEPIQDAEFENVIERKPLTSIDIYI